VKTIFKKVVENSFVLYLFVVVFGSVFCHKCGAVCCCLCFVFAWFVLLLLVVACDGERHLSRFSLHCLVVAEKLGRCVQNPRANGKNRYW
jgi:hypothetical protein